MTETITSSSPCRICMDAKIQQVSIFSGDLSRKVSEIADVQIQEGDGLPPSICEDCEIDLERCYRFRTQIIWADSKFRERLSVSEVVFEECHIKQEGQTFINEENQEDDDDDRPPSDNDDDDYDMRDDSGDKIDEIPQEKDQPTDPIDHVEIIENRTKQELHNLPSTDGNSQDEPLIVAQMKRENEPSSDPLMQSESQQPMDTESSIPGPSTSTPTVVGTENAIRSGNRARTNETRTSSRVRQSTPGSQSSQGNQIENMFYELGHFMNYDESDTNTVEEGDSKEDESRESLLDAEPSVTEDVPLNQDDVPLIKRKAESSPNKVTKLPRKSAKTRQQAKLEDNSFKTYDSLNCFVCNANYGDADLLEEHLKSNQFFCRVCTEEFNKHSSLEEHLLKTHIIHRCKSCNNVYFSKKDYLHHRKVSEACIKEKYVCEVCEKIFWKKKYLRLHRAKAHSVGSLKCGICSKTFSLAHILTSHLKAVHPVFENLECSFCQKLFLGPENLKKHVKLKHVEPLENSTFICEVCCKIFTNENLYKQHYKTHDKTEVLCELCGKSIAGQAAMKLHKRNEHPKTRVYDCPLCHQQFDSYNKFSNHKRNYHKDPSKQQAVYCEICGKKFKSKTVLKRHLLIHSDERTYKCTTCGAAFKQQVALYTHSRTHSDINNYSCYQCGMTFRWKQTFDKHVNKCHQHPHYLDLS